MPFTVRNSHKAIALVAAIAITIFLQSALLAGFDQMATKPLCVATAPSA